jgi:tetratricopeptide (TPR) repeat protein
LLGAIAAEDKRYAEAASCYRKAILMDAEFEEAYYDLAAMQLIQGEATEALETLTAARGRFTAGFVLEFYTGVALAAQKRYIEALKNYTAAELLAKASEPARLNHLFYFQVGAAYERLASAGWTEGRAAEAERQFAEAERNLRRSIELSGDNAEALNYLGYMWAERGRHLDEARDLIERALKIEPDSGAILDSMAWVLFQQKRLPEALEFMLKAIRASEKPDPTLFDHLGDIYAALGRPAEAREAWAKALKEDPSNTAIQHKLDASPAARPTPP